ncbi:MAG TPA: adenylate/guanylate cyclase domain-containing protein [Anaerolineae bacterium]|nr:adenylate/guanylate cyclase domain-containing protein [Anaerolineae bacterium]
MIPLTRVQRTERIILLIHICDFSAWSEVTSPDLVITMLNQFYELTEKIIVSGDGCPPLFTGDKVMSWFEVPEQAVKIGQWLNYVANNFLHFYGLSASIGLHTGDVIEGLLGSKNTRNHSIIGHAVLMTSQLVSAAKPGELLISEKLAQVLELPAATSHPRVINTRGQQQPLLAYTIGVR